MAAFANVGFGDNGTAIWRDWSSSTAGTNTNTNSTDVVAAVRAVAAGRRVANSTATTSDPIWDISSSTARCVDLSDGGGWTSLTITTGSQTTVQCSYVWQGEGSEIPAAVRQWADYAGDAARFNSPATPATPAERLREIMARRAAPAVITRSAQRPRGTVSPTDDFREARARETLSRVIGEDGYQRFLRDGFVSVRNRKSGRNYQIFPGNGLTRVYEAGRQIERLCVVLQGNYPPTDSLIVRFLLAINDEEKLWSLGIKHGPDRATPPRPAAADGRSLPELYRDMTARAG